VQECLQVRARHDAHAQERRLVQLRTRLAQQLLAEPAPVVRLRSDRSTACAGAGCMLDVGDPGAAHQLQRGVLVEERHHVRPGLEKGVDPSLVVPIAEHVSEKSAGQLGVLDDPLGLRQRVQWNPHPPARPRRCAAADRVLLHHDHPQAMPGRGDGRRETGRAGADHQQVTVGLSRRRRHRHPSSPRRQRREWCRTNGDAPHLLPAAPGGLQHVLRLQRLTTAFPPSGSNSRLPVSGSVGGRSRRRANVVGRALFASKPGGSHHRGR
jgi:hypothetical protein